MSLSEQLNILYRGGTILSHIGMPIQRSVIEARYKYLTLQHHRLTTLLGDRRWLAELVERCRSLLLAREAVLRSSFSYPRISPLNYACRRFLRWEDLLYQLSLLVQVLLEGTYVPCSALTSTMRDVFVQSVNASFPSRNPSVILHNVLKCLYNLFHNLWKVVTHVDGEAPLV